MYSKEKLRLTRAQYKARTLAKASFFLSCTMAIGLGLWQLRWGKASMECIIGLCVGYFIRSWGITLGFHRLATHKSFKTHPLVKALLLVAGTAAIQGKVSKWVIIHQRHHAKPDRPGDPHSPFYIGKQATTNPMTGLRHAHTWWLFRRRNVPRLRQRMARLCRNDPVLAFVDRTTVIWILAPFVVSYLIGGWQMVLWANFICLFVTYNGTWAVNSIGHSGTQKTSGSHDHSQNKWWVAFLTGEGFHGNHHERAGAANLGWKPWEIALDSGTCVLWLLERIGLVWGVSWHVPNPAH